MNVFITGISGFIGSALAKRLGERGHSVVGSVSTVEKTQSVLDYAKQCFVLRINEEFDPNIFQGIDVLVHCAHDLRKRKSLNNLEGTKKIAYAAINKGVKSQLYVGSHSAHENATSEYGRTKFELEKFFLGLAQIVVKPGLVVGHGGIFLRMYGFLQKYPVVPLIGGGRGELPVVSIDDLTDALTQLIENPRGGSYRLYNSESVTLKDLMLQIKRAGNFSTMLVPVPIRLVYAGLWMAEKAGLSLQVDLGNLKGFQANQSVSNSTNLDEFVSPSMSLEQMVTIAIGQTQS